VSKQTDSVSGTVSDQLTTVDAGAHVAEFLLSLHHATPQDSRLPPELRPYIGSILADRAQQRTRTLPTRGSRVAESLSPREHSILRSMSCGLPTNASLKSCRLPLRP
jgi:DNA-binding NarL/FixJ family response regulator